MDVRARGVLARGVLARGILPPIIFWSLWGVRAREVRARGVLLPIILGAREIQQRQQNVLQKELHSELKWLRGLPETNPDEHNPPLPGEDVLFSQYLRSRSPSCFSAQGNASNHDSNGRIYSQTINPRNIYLCAEGPYMADLIDQNTAKPENIPVKTTKPRITLRIRQPTPGPKPKVLLRLSQPKQVPAQRSLRPGIKNRRRRRT